MSYPTFTRFELTDADGCVTPSSVMRRLSDATIRARCRKLLGDSAGCVAVYVDMRQTHSFVRQAVGQDAEFEALA